MVEKYSLLLIAFHPIIGLSGAVMVLVGLFTDPSTDTNRSLFNNIESVLIFISLGAAVPSTFLIGYRINSSGVSSIHVIPSSLQRIFKHMMMSVVDSAAAYPLALLLYAVSIVVPSFSVMGSPSAEDQYCIKSVLIVVVVRSSVSLSDGYICVTWS